MFAFQILSDLHLERPEDFEHLTITPKAPNLALLGNIGRLVQMARYYFNFLTTQLLQFKTVFLVLGNYEVHGSKWSTVKDAIDTYRLLVERKRECGQELGQFVLLDRKAVHMNAGEDRLTVLGCTLFSKTPHDGDCFLDFDMTTDWDVTKHNE
ncbi:hypothetical protein PFICI_06038 [Pestalotiopsis fici W106-1]|uniref:Calcineurin-like phosphoesterase domain-containing protein n=1 Tax=Pestalotiopsis fici (strain W106-1 / CGMCC3.15140) TaxID=1229662 RepID=W3X780_PESFW|nr:uncharacterized protein PFICI_06038 [Pestalotiopsis fici W106-1]ETS81036.1 hypothetical protein PFICI_06038 [Pestalotiopsis fici W106-1]